MYFANVPNIYYPFTINGKEDLKSVKDITQNVRFRAEMLSNITLYDEYDIVDGETPEIIAAKYYGSANYHWVVMLANLRFDVINDFPLPATVFEQYVADKYGDYLLDTKYYTNNAGYIVDADDPEAYAVTNYEYEAQLNESKRRIKLISPDLLATIIKELDDLI